MKHLLTLLLAMGLWTSALAGKVEQLTFFAPSVVDSVSVTVVVPDDTTARYPTVYLLNGFGGDHRSWIDTTRPDLPDLADKWGVIFVCPDGRDSWYWDAPEDYGIRMETFITMYLVPAIDTHYPTLPDSANRAITGYSMGGHGALWLAMRHPDIWGNAGSMSGGVDIRPFPTRWKMAHWLGDIEEDPEVWDEHTVITLVDSLPTDALNITFDCGADDFFAQVNENLHLALKERGIPHTYCTRPGSHTHTYWRTSLPHHLEFFNQHFTRQ